MAAIDPTDVRDELEATARGLAAVPPSPAPSPVAPSAPVVALRGALPFPPPSIAPAAAPATDRDAILAGISASYFRLRRGLALVAFAFPIVLALGAGGTLQGSISAYYHFSRALCGPGGPCSYGGGIMRNVFVGGLWMIGSFLAFYRGYSRAEDRVLNVAGLAAVAISLSPMDWPAGAAATLSGRIHGTSAILFFLCIAYVAIFRARDTVDLLPEADRGRFLAVYRTLGALMVVLPLGGVALHLALPNPQSRFILAVEVSGIYTFAAFWLVKSREITLIERAAA